MQTRYLCFQRRYAGSRTEGGGSDGCQSLIGSREGPSFDRRQTDLSEQSHVPSTAPSANGTNHERSNGEDIASSSQDKGKAKAATVEDFIEDVD